jgi:hypothetical protein
VIISIIVLFAQDCLGYLGYFVAPFFFLIINLTVNRRCITTLAELSHLPKPMI